MTFSPDGMLNCVHRSKRPQTNQTGFHLSLPAPLFRSQNLSQDPHSEVINSIHVPPLEFIWSHHSYLVIVFLNKLITNTWTVSTHLEFWQRICVFVHRCCLPAVFAVRGEKKHICLCLKDSDSYLLKPQEIMLTEPELKFVLQHLEIRAALYNSGTILVCT